MCVVIVLGNSTAILLSVLNEESFVRYERESTGLPGKLISLFSLLTSPAYFLVLGPYIQGNSAI